MTHDGMKQDQVKRGVNWKIEGIKKKNLHVSETDLEVSGM